ncbi:MAG: NUDIX domain-containing protein [Candidatus Niyogibacteria bacterium]|nr:NUDIX domain-containing protein [Candidatus Niyogibacteria bacterium]
MENNIQSKGATFIALRPDGTMLMQLRDENCKMYPGEWTFPGGACDGDEDPLTAAVREAKEEYDLQLDEHSGELLMQYEAPYNNNLVEYVYMFPVTYEQSPVLREGADMKWMDLDEIKHVQVGFHKKEIVVPKLEAFLLRRQELKTTS